MMNIWLWFVTQLVLHEAGHYFTYKYYGINPKVKIRWFGVTVGEQKDFFKVSPKQHFWIGFNGVIIGLLYTLFVRQDYTYLYMLMCAVDFAHIYVLYTNKDLKAATFGGQLIKGYQRDIKELKMVKNGS